MALYPGSSQHAHADGDPKQNGHHSYSSHAQNGTSGHAADTNGTEQNPGPGPDLADDAALLGQLQTEGCDAAWADRIDALGTADLCAEFLAHEARVLPAIAASLPVIAALVDALVQRVRAGGRVFYVGAGNSGRVAHMDSTELPATFSADPAQFQALVAGGGRAVAQEAREDAEDSEADGAAALAALRPTALDAVLGVSASGRTPYVLGALRAARGAGALTAGITSCQPSGFGRLGVQYLVAALTGPEFVAGSTRLKAGTAAKQILNMISTCAMVRLGKTYRGLMLDVRARNHKLRARGRRILRQVCGTGPAYLLGAGQADGAPRKTDLASDHAADAHTDTDAALDAHFQRCGNSVKLACAVAVSGLDVASAQARLDRAHGHFHGFLALLQEKLPPPPFLLADPDTDDELVLAVDGGGTHCRVAVAARSGAVARAEAAGACSISCATPDELVAQIRAATLGALARLRAAGTRAGSEQHPASSLASQTALPRFARVWAGVAGLHHAFNPDALAFRLEALLGVSARDGSLRLTSDSLLLSACVGADDGVRGGLAVVAGTGSVAVAFRKMKADGGAVAAVGRAGGWGHLLGDDGSAFDIGRRALQAVLLEVELRAAGEAASEASEEEIESEDSREDDASALERGVLAALGARQAAQLLPRILHDADRAPKHQIAEMARVVTALAFPEAGKPSASKLPPPDTQALAILEAAAASLVARIKPLALSRLCAPGTDVLILSGALLNLAPYRALFLDAWARDGLPAFKKTVVVQSAPDWATAFLLRQTAESRR